MALEPGTQIGRYEIISLLGRGGMGEVYLASDTRLERTIALKVLPRDVSNNPQRMHRFDREARAASVLNHPNVAHIYEIEISGEHSFIAMEYINGETLREHLKHTRMKLHDALDIAVQVTRAIAAAHAAGIIHRDIKTENIMISRDGYVKVLDFGLAKLVESSTDNPDPAAPTVTSAHTDPGVVMGTFSYMSPEQARGLPADARTDLWSLGVVLYEMVSGTPPFVGKTPPDVLSSILNEEPPPLARFARDVPDALEWIVMKALTKDLEGRYQTATEFLTDLQRLKNRLGAEIEIERASLAEMPEFRLSRSSYMGNSRTGGFETSRASFVNTGFTNPVPRQSSAEYIINGFKRHKKATFAALAILVIAAGATAIRLIKGGNANANINSNANVKLNSLPPPTSLVRVTSERGLQLGATWSVDAHQIAYSSNQSGNFDIWIQSLSGGNPLQVTKSPAQDWQPDWSPVSDTIAFRSERDGGGIYVVPAFGGTERKVASFGYRPRWSPDGSKILFLAPGQRLYDFPKMYLIVPGYDEPREILTSFSNAEEGIKGSSVGWHPDGKRVSFMSTDGTFWTVPIAGGNPVKSELTPDVERRLKEVGVNLGNFRWAPSGRVLYFEGMSYGVLNLWKVTVEPESLRWIAGPDRVTIATMQESDIAISKDGTKLACTTFTQDTRIWLLPFDSSTGKIKGDGRAATQPGMDARFSDLSPDGKKLVFASYSYGMDKQVLREKSLPDGVERVLAGDDDYHRYFPRWSPDSRQLAYSRFRATTQQSTGEANPPQGSSKAGPIVLLDTQSREERLLTSQGQWLDYMYDWSPDGQFVLASSNRRTNEERWEVCLFPISAAPHAETEMRVVATDPNNSLWTPRFSPDGQWVCYAAQKPAGASVSILYVAPISGGTPVRITAEGAWCDWPRWSADGKTIYFVSNYTSSFLNVWGIRFDPAQGRAVDEPFRVTTFESPERMISPRLNLMEMSLNKNQLALPITEISGSIWMLGNLDR